MSDIDFMKEPSVEFDENNISLVWRSEDGKHSFAVVVTAGCLMGIDATLDPPRSGATWKVSIPRGLISIDENALKLGAA